VIPLRAGLPTRRLPVVTFALVLINVSIFAVQLLLPRWGLTLDGWYLAAGARPRELTRRMDLPPATLIPWWATLVTSLFVHGGWLHLAFNMLYLWIFGNNVEDVMGRSRFIAFYLVCGMVATTAQVLVDPRSVVPIIGASGAIAGVLGAYVVLYPRARVVTLLPLGFFTQLVRVPAVFFLGFWFLQQFLFGSLTLTTRTAQTGGVAWWAHIGGFAAGLALVGLFQRPRRRPAARDRWWEERR
jgi:membrane associated rhomboid family serine protease